jgi:hypothetical protein
VLVLAQEARHAEEERSKQQLKHRLALGRRKSTRELEEIPKPVYVPSVAVVAAVERRYHRLMLCLSTVLSPLSLVLLIALCVAHHVVLLFVVVDFPYPCPIQVRATGSVPAQAFDRGAFVPGDATVSSGDP